MSQMTFYELDYLSKRKTTQKERFLAHMEQVVPFARLVTVLEPHYPKTGAKGGRPPKPLATMLRVYMLQNWFGYSDPGMEEALHDITALRRFAGLNLVNAEIPDETTILNFRRLLEIHHLTDALFAEIYAHLNEKGLILKSGTIVDTTIIHAPFSAKDIDIANDLEMSSTYKLGKWYFGMKAHIGVDADSGAVHTVEDTIVSMHDSQKMEDCLHGEKKGVLGDSAYGSNEKADALAEKGTILLTPIKAKPGKKLNDLEKELNRLLTNPRSKVEHSFRIVKCQFGYRKTRFVDWPKTLCN